MNGPSRVCRVGSAVGSCIIAFHREGAKGGGREHGEGQAEADSDDCGGPGEREETGCHFWGMVLYQLTIWKIS